MANLRIKGQETAVTVTGPLGSEDGFKAVQSFEAEFLLNILEEGYLGEVAPRFDEIFMGASGTMDVHLEDPQYLAFVRRVLDRATRRNPGTVQFQIVTSMEFPGGDRVRVVFEDVKFGNLPTRNPGRDEYVSATVEWRCTRASILF